MWVCSEGHVQSIISFMWAVGSYLSTTTLADFRAACVGMLLLDLALHNLLQVPAAAQHAEHDTAQHAQQAPVQVLMLCK